jgi:hypothetical protein
MALDAAVPRSTRRGAQPARISVISSFVYEAREPSTSGVCEHATCASGTRVESECPMSMYQRRAGGLRVTELRDGVCRVSCVSCAV